MKQSIVKNEIKVLYITTEVFDELEINPTHKNTEHVVYVDIKSLRFKPSSYKALYHFYDLPMIN